MNRIETLQLCLDEIGCPLSASEVMDVFSAVAQAQVLAILEGDYEFPAPIPPMFYFWLASMFEELTEVGQ